MDFLQNNVILKLDLDVLVFVKKGEIKIGRYENKRDIYSKLQIIVSCFI